jgi:hypothetical protein
MELMGTLYNRVNEILDTLAREGGRMPSREWTDMVRELIASLLQYRAILEKENYDLLQTTLHQEDEIEQLEKKLSVKDIREQFNPPLDLPAPHGKDAEWALLRVADAFGVDKNCDTWDELTKRIIQAGRNIV